VPERPLLEATPAGGVQPARSILASVLAHCLFTLALLGVRTPVQDLVTRYEPVRLTAPSLPDSLPPPNATAPELAATKLRPTPRPFVVRVRTQLTPLESPPPIELPVPEPHTVEVSRAVPAPPPIPSAEKAAPRLPQTNTGVFGDVAIEVAEPPSTAPMELPATGAFSASAPRSESASRNATTNTGRFGSARLEQVAFVRYSSAEPATGAFAGAEHPAPISANTGRGDPEVTSGFGQAPGFRDHHAASPDRQASLTGNVVMSSGFGAALAATATATPGESGNVGNAGFGEVTARPAVSRDADQRTELVAQTPIEILGKPRPEYTAEGRRLQIEGEVAIEARFAANGQITVLRILQGLGHGLDECAQRATEAIRFRPAQQDGQPVDSVAVVRITFQLAY
jgi:TonB family protein